MGVEPVDGRGRVLPDEVDSVVDGGTELHIVKSGVQLAHVEEPAAVCVVVVEDLKVVVGFRRRVGRLIKRRRDVHSGVEEQAVKFVLAARGARHTANK